MPFFAFFFRAGRAVFAGWLIGTSLTAYEKLIFILGS
jgi:hypothetical protein